ncbi:MAG: hypothetical protein OFPII_06290 [Osedax symbiont Rs1]|nr:MAG: hypothetical protein OFPII_06290 [Osedax symbiont Rs1]
MSTALTPARIQQRQFYLFVCSHSFLIGLFPFFLPVYLYKQGLDISKICYFIAASAITFSISLYVWDRIKNHLKPNQLLALCYLLELLMVTSVIYAGPKIVDQQYFAYLIAASYGCYQCFFWTTQRALFIQRSASDNTGNRYGNFQVFVVIFLKMGVFIGGFLLDSENIELLLLISLLCILLSYLAVLKSPGQLEWPFLAWPKLSLKNIYQFKDQYRSRQIFALDGLFLFIESFFWLLSLFLILKQSFMQLGLMIIAITIILSMVFLVLKNKIDQLPEQLIYSVSIVGYAISWVLRANLQADSSLLAQFLLLCMIAFLTAFFRLAFNKRFYDLAVHYPKKPYTLIKSYYSQTALLLFFVVLGLVFSSQNIYSSLTSGYWLAAILSPLYCIYKTRISKGDSEQVTRIPDTQRN